jgi:hypothetical protein
LIKKLQESDTSLFNANKPSSSTWEQTPEEVTVSVKVPAGTPAKLINCQITKKKKKKDHLIIGIKAQTPNVDGQLSESVKNHDTCWIISNTTTGREVQVFLVKQNGDAVVEERYCGVTRKVMFRRLRWSSRKR